MARELVYVLVFLTLTGTAWADQHGGTYLETAATAREILWKTITSGNTNATTLAVMDRGKIVYSQGFGVVDRRTGRPIEAETRFNIGSTSKMFAAVAILLPHDEGKLSLEDPATKRLPEFTIRDPRHRDITIRVLFNHSSGLPGTTFLEFLKEQVFEPLEMQHTGPDIGESPGSVFKSSAR